MATSKDSSASYPYDPTGLHQAEAVYSTPISSALRLHSVNECIHSIQSLPQIIEFVIFLFGYAFNPVSLPVWVAAVTWAGPLPSSSPLLLFAPTFYLATVLVTLVGTELSKACFRATRPEAVLSTEFRSSKLRRYGTLVASLKSKHSFPSGDSGQAANLVLFLHYYILPSLRHTTIALEGPILSKAIRVFAFGIFYLGVAFARIFYHCHWIEDCLGGALLAFILHQTIVPLVITDLSFQVAQKWLF
jgi:membrane-associated phospholipid phosphatase